MSKYTTQVRFICETAAGVIHSDIVESVDNIIQAAIPTIFNFDFPIFDETYRNVLETKILKHYYTREIGEETVGLWKLRLNTTLNEIMPYYNKLYESELLEFNPLYDVNYTRTGNRDTDETGSETGQGTSSFTDAMTGTVADSGTDTNQKTMTGTVDDSGTDTNRKTMTGTVDDSGTDSNRKTMTGTVTDQGTDESTTSGTISKTTTNGGTDTENTQNAAKNDRWDYFSDTPQGTIGSVPGGGQQALEGQTYLTNVHHITDDGTGSTSQKTMQHGHTITESGTNSGTVESETNNTKTYNTVEADSGTNANTRTYNTVEADSGSNANTRTYNTVEADNGTNANTRTYNTENERTGSTTETRSKTLQNLQEYTERVAGKMGGASMSKLLMEFRETFLNIDMQIIDDLSPLFFGLWE